MRATAEAIHKALKTSLNSEVCSRYDGLRYNITIHGVIFYYSKFPDLEVITHCDHAGVRTFPYFSFTPQQAAELTAQNWEEAEEFFEELVNQPDFMVAMGGIASVEMLAEIMRDGRDSIICQKTSLQVLNEYYESIDEVLGSEGIAEITYHTGAGFDSFTHSVVSTAVETYADKFSALVAFFH